MLENGSFSLREPAYPNFLSQAVSSLNQSRANPFFFIEYFFDCLNQASLDKHSHFRMKFWKSFLDEQKIEQCWLILAPLAEEKMIKAYQLGKNNFGRLVKSKRVEDSHAVLLMRINGWVVAEWSHVGKCHLWKQTSNYAPHFLKPFYSKDELTDFSDKIQQHYFAEKGLWQKDLSLFLESK